jgi:hypothetical protein
MPPNNVAEIAAAATLAGLTALSIGFAAPAGATSPTTPLTTPTVVVPQPQPVVAHAALAGPLQVFFGNLHSHTSYSDGTGTPAEAFAHARNVARLDFLAITEHNHIEGDGTGVRNDDILIAATPELYDGPQATSLVSAAASATQDDTFVALYGQEFSTTSSGNHVNVFDVRGVISAANGNFRELVETWLPAHQDTLGTPQLIQLNHPYSKGPSDVGAPASGDSNDVKKARTEYGADDFANRAAWVEAMDRHAELIEVFNGPALTDGADLEPNVSAHVQYRKYLNMGFHLGPTGNQDNHFRTWGTITDVRTGIVAPSLTKANVLGALKARHVYATRDKNLRFVAHAVVGTERHLMGDLIAPPDIGSAFEIHYVLDDEDEPAMRYDIDVFSDVVGGDDIAEVLLSVEQNGNTPATGGRIQGLTYDGGRQYFLIRVTQLSEHGTDDSLWTAPVWFEQVTAQPPPGPAGPDPSGFVASRNSGIFHVSQECRFARQIAAANRVTGTQAAQGRTMHTGCPVQ